MSLFSPAFDRLQLKVPDSRSCSSVGLRQLPRVQMQMAIPVGTGPWAAWPVLGEPVGTQLLREGRAPSLPFSGSHDSDPAHQGSAALFPSHSFLP